MNIDAQALVKPQLTVGTLGGGQQAGVQKSKLAAEVVELLVAAIGVVNSGGVAISPVGHVCSLRIDRS